MRAAESKKILELSNVVSACKDGDELLNMALPAILEYFGGSSISLSMYKQQGSKEWHGDLYSPSLDESWFTRYRDHYHILDPFTHAALERREEGRGTAVITSDIAVDDDYASSEFLTEFLRPQSIYHMLCVCLYGDGLPIAFLGVHRSDPESPFSGADREKVEMLEPALSSTVHRLELDKHLEVHRWLGQRLAQNFPAKAVFFLDEDLNLLFADTRSRQLLAQLSGDQPTADWLPRDLQRCCKRLIRASREKRTMQSNEISISTQQGPVDGVVHIQTLPTGRPGFLVVLGSIEDSVLSDAVAEEFGLTPREFDVVNLIFAGQTNTVIAHNLGTSVRTVQNHLRSIYRKAEVHNRTSLVNRLIMASVGTQQ